MSSGFQVTGCRPAALLNMDTFKDVIREFSPHRQQGRGALENICSSPVLKIFDKYQC